MKRIFGIALGITAVVVMLVAGAARRAPSRERVSVNAQLAGKVKAFRVQEGQTVRQGQILAILENDAYAAECAAAVANLKTTHQAKGDVSQARARVDQAYEAWYKTFVRAPVSGVVAKRLVRAGESIASPATPVLTITSHQ
jgi:multidrug resistance efflux pump